MKTEIPEMVCWHEGMPLLPQHFQMQSLRAEILAARHAATAHPYYWGITHLEFDLPAIQTGIVRVLSLEAVMPDGLLVRHDAATDEALEFDCATLPPEQRQGTLALYLAVPPLYRAGRLSIFDQRYTSVRSAAIVDLASGDFPEEIAVLRPAVRIAPENGRGDSVTLPLLRLTCHEGGYSLAPYMPPMPVTPSDSILGRRLAALGLDIREKAVFLSGRLQAAMAARDALLLFTLDRQYAGLVALLPRLEAALHIRAHPLALYFVLCDMLGALAGLKLDEPVPYPRPFDYLDILQCVEPLLAAVESRVALIRTDYRRHPFAREGEHFSIMLPGLPQGADTLVIGLRMPVRAVGRDAAQWLEEAVIASSSHVDTLMRQRMRGLPRQALGPDSTSGFNAEPGVYLFALKLDAAWFNPAEALHIRIPFNDKSAPEGIMAYVRESEA